MLHHIIAHLFRLTYDRSIDEIHISQHEGMGIKIHVRKRKLFDDDEIANFEIMVNPEAEEAAPQLIRTTLRMVARRLNDFYRMTNDPKLHPDKVKEFVKQVTEAIERDSKEF